MKNALMGLLLSLSAVSCQTERTAQATAESVKGVGANSAAAPTPNVMLSIQSLESNAVAPVQFNPKELTIDKSNDWQSGKGGQSGSGPWAGKGQTSGDAPELEFVAAEPRTMGFELLFDRFEEQGNVHKEFVVPLLALAEPLPELKRPPRVRVTWGTLPAFEGVIVSVSTKYTMFLPDGTPVRATVNLTLKESSSGPCASDADCDAHEICQDGFCHWFGK